MYKTLNNKLSLF